MDANCVQTRPCARSLMDDQAGHSRREPLGRLRHHPGQTGLPGRRPLPHDRRWCRQELSRNALPRPCPPRGNAPAALRVLLIATSLEAGALPPGLDKTAVLEGTQRGGKALSAREPRAALQTLNWPRASSAAFARPIFASPIWARADRPGDQTIPKNPGLTRGEALLQRGRWRLGRRWG